MIPRVGRNEEDGYGRIPRQFPAAAAGRKRSLAEDLDVGGGAGRSPDSVSGRKRVVIVMDALEEFSTGPLVWALAHVIDPTCIVTILGVMPWLNFPLSCKTWLDVWTLDLVDLSVYREGRREWKSDHKYQTARAILDLCDHHGVVPYMKVAMGHPQRLVVLEQTTNLHATWVVFDRHHRKRRAFYKERIPCNMVMMNPDGGVDMLKVRPMLQSRELDVRLRRRHHRRPS